MTIYVGSLSFHAEREDLPDLFSQYTEVRQNSFVSIAIRAVIAGFVLGALESDASEQKAMDDLQNVQWMGRMIRAHKAPPPVSGRRSPWWRWRSFRSRRLPLVSRSSR